MRKFNLFGGAKIAACVLTVSIILAELIGPFKTFLKTTFSHHWIGKIVLVALAFALFGYFSKEKASDEKAAWKSIVASLVIILLFYLIMYLVE